jgi:uncharacterized protein
LATVDDRFFEVLDSISEITYSELSGEKKELVDMMLEGNFIVNDEFDELKSIKFRHFNGKYNGGSLGLTIAPTLSCNFACPYCYEDPKQGVMNQSTMDAIIKMVRDAAKKGNDVHITWYGGEPLTAKKVIYSLSEQIISICSEFNVSYNSYIVTNGYLINDEVINHFKKYKIDGAQITIDGPPEIHNTRRKLKGNSGDTFYVILENVKKLLRNNINVSIRINVDKTNVTNVEELLNILEANNLQGLSVNLGQVTAYTEACMSIAESCLNTEEYAKENVIQQELLFKKGFNVANYPYYPGVKANYCCADAVDSYVLDPNGFMYKCWNDVGNQERAVGNINTIHEPTNETMYMRNADYLLWSPFNFQECIECDVLPICMGGCPYNGELLGNKPDCEKWKYNLDDVLKLTYLQRYKESLDVPAYVTST